MRISTVAPETLRCLTETGFSKQLDRWLTGKVLLAEPFVSRLTWARGIGPDGRPIRIIRR